MKFKRTVIKPSKGMPFKSILQIFSYTKLYKYLFFLIATQKFRETILGAYWIIIRPLLPAIVTIFVFTRVANLDSDLDVPYPLFYFSGYLFWSIFAACISFLPRGLRMNRGLMKRVYFPRVIIPFASIAIPISEFIVTLIAFLILFLYFILTGQFLTQITMSTLLLPVLFFLTLLNGISIGMFLGALSLVTRDILFLIPYATQILLIATPIIYPIDKLPYFLRLITLIFNPMTSITLVSRDIILRGNSDFPFLLLFPTVLTTLFLIFSCRMFTRAESIFMEEI